jgi:uncharacterized protein YjiS (DUF1127 family)
LPAEANERRQGSKPEGPLPDEKKILMETIMSTITRAPAAAVRIPARTLAWRVGAALKRWWVARMERRLEHLAIRQLQAMSDRELKDIGIARSQIEFSVRTARDRTWRLSAFSQL